MVTKLSLTKQIADKRLEAAQAFRSNPTPENQKLKEILVEINTLKAQLTQLESA